MSKFMLRVSRFAAGLLIPAITFTTPTVMAHASETPRGHRVEIQQHLETAATGKCTNRLVRLLKRAGFRGHNIAEAWAIAMRESNGRPRQVSNSDYGLFQFNAPSWSRSPWWDWDRILKGRYNARMAYNLSQGGRNWQPWGMRDHMEWDFSSYSQWSQWQWQNWIIEPYTRYYQQFPRECRQGRWK